MTTATLQWVGLLYGALLGGCFASFGCVISERVPAGLGIGGRSHCVCGRQLRALENIPVLGWLRTRGKARCCGETVPVRYVLWEVAYSAWGGAVVGCVWRRAVTGGVSSVGMGGFGVAAVLFFSFFAVLLAATWQRPTRPNRPNRPGAPETVD